MENSIIDLVLHELNSQDIWFTTKNDPTYTNPSHYYDLDKYGDLTDKAVKEIEKEVSSYIGDGAVNEIDAVQLWIADASADSRIGYKDYLVTNFEPKPVVDQIEAYVNPVQLAESKEIKTESKDVKTILTNLNVSTFQELRDEIDKLLEQEVINEEYEDFLDIISEQEEACEDYIRRRSEVTNTDFNDELGIESDYVLTAVKEIVASVDNLTESNSVFKVQENIDVLTEEYEDIVNNPDKEFRYMMLSRLQSDCEYFLGNGNGYIDTLWAKDINNHIKLMRDLYNTFKEDEKPEWITPEKIDEYERRMKDYSRKDEVNKVTELYDPIESKLPDLAREVQEFMYNFDTYDYNDNYMDDEEAFEDAMQTLIHPISREQAVNKLKEIVEEDNEQSIKDKAQELINRINEFAKELDEYEANDNIDDYTKDKFKVTEGAIRRLEEVNNKSQNLISQMFQADNFDSDSEAGQIVIRTSELFNALSDKGYDVQVSFDNGESTSAVLLGQQGGQAVITITNTNQPLRVFASGNFEVTDDNIKTLQDIQQEIEVL